MTTPMTGVLTDHQAAVARDFVLARERERDHLVVYLSGAHAYGFPSPDSDLDLKCVHVAPTRELVGLVPYEEPKDTIEIVDGVELDYGSNELGGVLRGCIKGNGNYLERILGKLVVGGRGELLAEARAVVAPLVSRRVGRHYGGFARSQLELFDAKPTAKRALYVLRTTATGRHLLATGELVTDLTQLPQYAPAGLDELLAIKQRAEQEQLTDEQRVRWREHLVAAIAAVDDAWPTSVLPVDPPEPALAAADAWLRDVRHRHW
ncbi:MAG TPA: nucleotidyltransferase domain-containing protein [Kofleriaceae bacterium]|nr:nucleotidyltransferase domain-containing protein [Kofleriaceae bacterium]